MAGKVGERLNVTPWFLVRAESPDAFILSDSPVVATLSFGFDDQWRAIFANETYIVLMPLHPLLCLVFAPQHIVPVSKIEHDQLVETINRAMWRAANRFVIGRSQADFGGKLPNRTGCYRLRPSSTPRTSSGKTQKWPSRSRSKRS